MNDRKQTEDPMHFERYVLTLQHQYITQENKDVKTIDIDDPIKVVYMMNPSGPYPITSKIVVINEMLDKMKYHLLNQIEE